ncbi:L-amino acid N-acyltransferase YncA [Jatrophihabitans sp. GAS493]|uniref:GNAT family N-acetyltransferase n=1 Tax=Jatrophihabitans sp. GAS493 TaxID=1907575 RepID=UPI000BB8BBC5|nr:GNAT family N-acetyltransferase [Jatrophihabitans sp. GAS493]SOD74393.1 L-amino acid N-acyltransferase YncA [Jatrophihabitans sp. GAS493]
MPQVDEPPITIRLARPADTAALARLRHGWSEENAGAPIEDTSFNEEFAQWFADEADRRATYLAESAGLAIGMMNVVVFQRMPRPAQPSTCWCYLGNAFVLPDYRNRGTGRQLLEAVLGHAQAINAVRIVLAPSERSVPFYERAGFGAASMLMAMTLAE